jgi:hypothetical protein
MIIVLNGRRLALLLGGVVLVAGAWHERHRIHGVIERTAHSRPPAAPATVGAPTPMSTRVAEVIFAAGRKPAWQDWGWAPHDDVPNGPARVDMSNWAGWQLVHPGLSGDFGGLSFRFKAPPEYGDFLTVRLENNGDKSLPEFHVDAASGKLLPDGFREVAISVGELDPDERPFDRVVFFVSKGVPRGWVAFDDIVLTALPDPSTLPPVPPKDIAMTVSCTAKAAPIHPLIYGTAAAADNHDWTIGMAGRRWGGNPSSRYNWQVNALNHGKDWFFENYASDKPYSAFLRENLEHHAQSILTVPMIGWVAKDTTSSGFPRSLGNMDAFDQWRPEAGNGLRSGKDVTPGPPTTTSVPAPPAFIQHWVEAIRREDQARGGRSVTEYVLDNEPNLWSVTHRDVHPDPLSYDELLQRTIEYATAIRAADHDALIAGPAEWGWTGYSYSAKDMVSGATTRPDRRAHGDVPLAAWYLKKLREHEQKTGTRVIDVFDLHFYPQGNGVYSAAGGKGLDALRIRSTRALWDPSYVDESWIGEPVMLIPRMKAWVAENYPGLGISIGEWSFGGEGRMSGALAVAEALGRFGQLEVTSAFYWLQPPVSSPAFWAFRAYRNFDARGARFEDFSLPTTAGEGTSLFASRDEKGTHFVFIALNLMRDTPAHAHIDAAPSSGAAQGPWCGHSTRRELYQYTGGPLGFGPPKPLPTDGPLVVDLPPSSISVVDVHVGT